MTQILKFYPDPKSPESGLFAGQVGTVVEKLADGVFEIEFCDDQGRTYAELAVPGKTLMRPATLRS